MIGFLKGVIAAKHPPTLLVDVNGVGYELEAPMSTFYTLPDLGGRVELFTHLVIRDDAHVLYGFATGAERQLFRGLLKVSGIGARMALAILSGTSVEGFVQCVQSGDVASLTRIPGIGRKTAERLIVEMRDRLEASATPMSAGGAAAPARAGDEARDALVALGYKPAEAQRLVRTVETDGRSTEEIIRAALQAAAR
ncbi:MAG: Holliday junction branch migration protein RuvA [Gammaproteobacteria bacterium]